MIQGRKIVIAIVGGLALCTSIHAAMMPLSGPDAAGLRSPRACVQTDAWHTDCLCPLSCPSVAGPDSRSFGLLPEAYPDVGQTCQTQSLQILTDGQGSLSLCAYALIGLGLFRCAPLVRKLSFGFVPDWYHNGGPYQIGHSLAVSPDCLCPAPVLCFIQPDCRVKDLSPQYYTGTIASLLRKSQFTSSVLAARGPPFRSL